MKYIWHIQFSKLREPRDLADIETIEIETETIEKALEGAKDYFAGAIRDFHILEIRRGKRA